MKVIIAGTRHIKERDARPLVAYAVRESGWREMITEVVSGKCRGVDTAGEDWADYYSIPVKPFPYKSELGSMGGPVRNSEMAAYADALIAVWDECSYGTKDMIQKMKAANKPVFVVKVRRQHGVWNLA